MLKQPEFWAVVTLADTTWDHILRVGHDPREPSGPLIMEAYLSKSDKAGAIERARHLKNHGYEGIRIARLVQFEEVPDVETVDSGPDSGVADCHQ